MAVPTVSISAQHVTHERVQQFLAAIETEPPLRTVHLGRVASPPEKLKGLVRFGDYLKEIPTPPASKSWMNAEAKKSIDLVLGNDQQGDCVIASDGHDCVRRPPVMDLAREWLRKHYGEPVAEVLCVTNPSAALSGSGMVLPDVASPSSVRKWYEFWR